MMTSKVTGIAIVLGTCLTIPAIAQDAEESAAACIEAARLIQEDQDFDAALDEAQWCVEGLKQIKQAQTLAILPDEVDGYIGGEVGSQSMLGMSMIERAYVKDGNTINVSLMAGGSGAGGLAALAQIGMGMGTSAGGKKIRIQKRTVLDNSTPGGDSTFMVQLKSGGMMNVESSSVGRDDVVSFLRKFPIAEIDDAL